MDISAIFFDFTLSLEAVREKLREREIHLDGERPRHHGPQVLHWLLWPLPLILPRQGALVEREREIELCSIAKPNVVRRWRRQRSCGGADTRVGRVVKMEEVKLVKVVVVKMEKVEMEQLDMEEVRIDETEEVGEPVMEEECVKLRLGLGDT